MNRSTVNFHRQVIRLCKGIVKAWEQWVEEGEEEDQEPSKKPSGQEQSRYDMTIKH